MDRSEMRKLAWSMSPEELEEFRDEFERVRLLKLSQQDFDELMPDDIKHLVAERLYSDDVGELGRLSRVNRSFRDVSSRYISRASRRKEAEMKDFEEKFIYLQPLLDFVVRKTTARGFKIGLEVALKIVFSQMKTADDKTRQVWGPYLNALEDRGVTENDTSRLSEWYEASVPAQFTFSLFLGSMVYNKLFLKGGTMHDIAVFMSSVPFGNERYAIEFTWNCKTIPPEMCRSVPLKLFDAKARDN